MVLPKYEKLLGIKIDCKLSFDDHMRNFSQCFIYLFFVLYVWCTLNCQLKNKEIIMKNKNSYELCSAIAFLNNKKPFYSMDDVLLWWSNNLNKETKEWKCKCKVLLQSVIKKTYLAGSLILRAAGTSASNVGHYSPQVL